MKKIIEDLKERAEAYRELAERTESSILRAHYRNSMHNLLAEVGRLERMKSEAAQKMEMDPPQAAPRPVQGVDQGQIIGNAPSVFLQAVGAQMRGDHKHALELMQRYRDMRGYAA